MDKLPVAGNMAHQMFAVKLINKHPAFVKQAGHKVVIPDRLRYCALSK
jgi:hypothetical protein